MGRRLIRGSKVEHVIGSIMGLALLSLVSPSQAETVQFRADLKGSAQMPPNQTAGTGTVDATYDSKTKRLSWKGSYSGMSGPPTAAHIHGPAPVGTNARLVVWISDNVGQCSQGACKSNHDTMAHSLPNPFEGAATLNEAQVNDLMTGLYYINIHSDAYPSGELRGQLIRAP
jgi:hypothetical protein